MLREERERSGDGGSGRGGGRRLASHVSPQPLSQPNRGTYLIPGTSQDRGREEDEDS